MESGSKDEDGRATRLLSGETTGVFRDALRRAEEEGVPVFAQPDAPFEDVMTLESYAGRAIVLLGRPTAALAALWVRWALSDVLGAAV